MRARVLAMMRVDSRSRFSERMVTMDERVNSDPTPSAPASRPVEPRDAGAVVLYRHQEDLEVFASSAESVGSFRLG